ncbi:glycosyltransferase family 4 protein [Roseivirga thermotolerans]|uniref:Glycosyl transferase family 1 n=1 Tax=Roseivirga thermotolerans TaxID=1758176 RepID=A0ABQ3I8U5_9BACT|nr:glycosyltransferase family 4 protein [Roseivirga thermotolerans]GHE68599.1 glycosyl transferase family 1 [Roseivirga thermotolerans]
MKVVFIVPNLTPGGIQKQAYLLGKYFSKSLGFQVTFVGMMAYDEIYVSQLKEEGISVIFRPDLGDVIWNYNNHGFFRRAFGWFRLWVFQLSFGRSLLFTFTRNADLFMNVLVNFSLIKRSFSFERGGHDSIKPESPSMITYLRRKANPIYVANSNHGRDSMAKIKNINPSIIYVVPNGIELNSYMPRKNEGSKLRIVMVANFFNEKEHCFVIESLFKIPLVELKRIELKFVGLGGGRDCQDNFNKAQKLVNELGMSEYIHFEGQTNNVENLLSQMDIGLLATKSEGCPNAILEYMRASLPVLASKIPGVQEVISKANEQFLFENGNVKEFQSKLLFLLSSKHMREKVGKQNRLHVEMNFSVQKMCGLYSDILRKENLLN